MTNKIIIEKKEEEITYQRITKTHTFSVNGKNVRVYEVNTSEIEDVEYPEADENDMEKLTDEENEIFGEDMDQYLSLKVGDKEEVDGWDDDQ